MELVGYCLEAARLAVVSCWTMKCWWWCDRLSSVACVWIMNSMEINCNRKFETKLLCLCVLVRTRAHSGCGPSMQHSKLLCVNYWWLKHSLVQLANQVVIVVVVLMSSFDQPQGTLFISIASRLLPGLPISNSRYQVNNSSGKAN